MPVFSRRRIQQMLNAIGALSTENQTKDLFGKLCSRNTSAVLAAELELGLLWALSQVTKIQTHPLMPTGRQPEAFCPELFPSAPAYVEITAISDDTFSDRDKMERAATKISHYANQVRTNSGNNLYFQFAEKSGFKNGLYYRERCIAENFDLTDEITASLSNWLANKDWPNPKQLRLRSEEIDVTVKWKSYVHPEGRTFSTMPPIPYDLEDNPVYNRLQKKRAQLSGAPVGYLKCIFLVDAGCDTLRILKPTNAGINPICGEKIIWHFLQKSSIDIVVVLSAQSENIYNPIRSPRIWRITTFDKRQSLPAGEHLNLRNLAAVLPKPNYEAYQARSLQRQGIFDPQRSGQYLGTHIIFEGVQTMKTELKFSARLFQEFLAGRISAKQFQDYSLASETFESQLRNGCILKNTRIESGGLDEDDDYIVFEFAPDPSALPFKLEREPQV